MATRLFEILQGLLAEWDGDLVAALRRVLDDEIVERTEASWNLVPATGSLRHGARLCRGQH